MLALSALLFTSCATGDGPRLKLPIAVALGYQVPGTDVVLVLNPSAKSATGYSLEMRGTYKGLEQTATGWKFTSPKSGLTYEIDTTTSPPTLSIIGSGQVGDVIINPDPVAVPVEVPDPPAPDVDTFNPDQPLG